MNAGLAPLATNTSPNVLVRRTSAFFWGQHFDLGRPAETRCPPAGPDVEVVHHATQPAARHGRRRTAFGQ